jgi:UPF0755 protein
MSDLQMQGKTSGKKKKKRKALYRIILFLFFVTLILCSSIISYNYTVAQNDIEVARIPEISPDERIAIEVPKGASTVDICDMLEEKGVVNHPFIFKLMSKINGYDGTYKSGTHYVSKKLDYDMIMRILSSDPVSKKVMIPEGYTFKQIADKLFKENLIDKTKFTKVANEEKFDYEFLKGLPDREFKLEGYLFPDTYVFDINAGEKTIIDRMLARFKEVYKPEYEEKAKKLGMTTDQVIILASIVEREAKEPEERRTIAGIFYNRLKSKDPKLKKLQSCATIQYIFMNRDGTVKEKITDEDTKINDPYNTYQIEGLPPGPICVPGKDSIEAVLEPEDTDYYYFVAKGDGTHQFSRTLKEHQAAAKKYGVAN